MIDKEIFKVMKEVADLNGNEMIPTIVVYNMTYQLFKGIKPNDVSKEFYNVLAKLEKRGDIYSPKRNYWKITSFVKEEKDYNQTYEKEEMLGDKSIDEKLNELYSGLLSSVKIGDQEIDEIIKLEDRVSRIENALLELAHYPCKNEFNRDDIYLALRKAGMVRGNKNDKN